MAAATVVGLVAFLLGTVTHRWTTPAGVDPSGPDAVGAQAESAGIDLDGVVDTVTHRVTPVPGEAGVLESVDDRYRATFDGEGFALDDFGVSLAAVRRGDGVVPLRLGPWRADAWCSRRRDPTCAWARWW